MNILCFVVLNLTRYSSKDLLTAKTLSDLLKKREIDENQIIPA